MYDRVDSYDTLKIQYGFWGVVINFQTSAIALGASTDGLLIPTAMVKAMPVFRCFDYGHSAGFVQGKTGDPSSSCEIVVYPRDKYSLLTSLQPKYGQQNHPEVPAKQVPFWSPKTRTSSSDDRQKLYLPKGYARILCHLTIRTVLTEWQLILTPAVSVSSVWVRYLEMSLNILRRNKLLHSVWVNMAPCGSPEENGPPRICQFPSETPFSISYWHFW